MLQIQESTLIQHRFFVNKRAKNTLRLATIENLRKKENMKILKKHTKGNLETLDKN